MTAKENEIGIFFVKKENILNNFRKMKKLILLLVVMLSTPLIWGQDYTVVEPDTSNTAIELHPFHMRLAKDSSLFTNKDLDPNIPLIFILFSPTCGHCQHQTRIIEENMDKLKSAQIVMITWLPYAPTKTFYTNLFVYDYPGITVGCDPGNRKLLSTYEVGRYPKIIMYDKNKKFVEAFNGDQSIDVITKVLDSLK